MYNNYNIRILIEKYFVFNEQNLMKYNLIIHEHANKNKVLKYNFRSC